MKKLIVQFTTRLPILLALLSPVWLQAQPISITGPVQVCPGAIVDYSAPLVGTNAFYTWTAPPGCLINGQPSPYTIDAPNGLTVQVVFGNVGGQVCLEVNENGNTLAQGCLAVTNQPIPPTNLPPLTVCFEDIPYYWDLGGIIIYNSGVYTTTYNSYQGCDSIVKQQIIVKPPIYVNLGNIVVPPGDCYISGNGNEFCYNGVFNEVFESYQGCDSIVLFNIIGGLNCNLTVSIAPPEELTCGNDAVTLYATSNSPNATYAWSGPQGFPIFTQNPVVTQPGFYSVTATDVTNGCTGVAVVNVVANFAAPQVSVASSVIKLTCADNEQQLQAIIPPNNNYIWQWSGPSIHPESQYLLDPLVSQEGVYQITVTNTVNECTAIEAVFVLLDGVFPVADAGPDLNLSCQSQQVRLNGNASSSGSNISVLWTGPGINASNETQRRPWVDQKGLYKIFVTDLSANCTKVDYAYVQDFSTPPTASAGPDLTLDCANSAGIQLDASGSTTVTGGNFMRLWAGPGVDSINRSQMTPTVTVPGVYQLTITEAATGCTDTDEVVVSAAAGLPVASAGPDQLWASTSPDVTLDGSGSSSGPGFKYVWSGPGITSSNKNLQNPVVNVPGRYVLRVYDLASNCNTRDRVLVIDSGQSNSDALENDDLEQEASANTVERNGQFNPFTPDANQWHDVAQIRQWLVYDSKGAVVLRASQISPTDLPGRQALQEQPAGLYFWYVEYVKTDGKVERASGKWVR